MLQLSVEGHNKTNYSNKPYECLASTWDVERLSGIGYRGIWGIGDRGQFNRFKGGGWWVVHSIHHCYHLYRTGYVTLLKLSVEGHIKTNYSNKPYGWIASKWDLEKVCGIGYEEILEIGRQGTIQQV